MPTVTILWDGRPRFFELDKLETAWLIFQEEVKNSDGGAQTAIRTIDRLIEEHGWSKTDAYPYAVIMKNKKWEPS